MTWDRLFKLFYGRFWVQFRDLKFFRLCFGSNLWQLFLFFNFHCQIDFPSYYSERMFNSKLIFITFGRKIIFL